MQAWYHCENVYPFVPQEVLDRAPSVRASLPNKYCDPKIAANLFEECLDEHLLCDDLGINVAANPVHVHDFQATVLHLLGIDHKRLTFKFQGRDFRLTDVHGEVVKPILA